MKTQKNILTLLVGLLTVQVAISQDLVIDETGREIPCNITRVGQDTLFFSMTAQGQQAETFLPMSKVKEFHIKILEDIKADLDTTAFYMFRLDDGTNLFGKIQQIDGTLIKFDDNMLNMLAVKSELIKSMKREKKNAFYRITLSNGNEMYGRIIERTKTELVFDSKSLGEVRILSKNVSKLEEVAQSKVIDGDYWFPNPNSTRYLFAPSAINLKKGEGYYQNSYVLANSVNYGFSDHFSMGGAAILPFVLLLTPKVGFEVAKNFHLGAGSIMGIWDGPSFGGIFYGVATYGNTENNITVGSGYLYFDEESIERPIITLNAMGRLSKRIAVVTENWMIPYYDYDYSYYTNESTKKLKYMTIVSYGIRIMKENITFDIALINNKDILETLIIGVPYIDFVYKF